MTELEKFVALIQELGIDADIERHTREVRRPAEIQQIDVGQSFFQFDLEGTFLGYEVDNGMGYDPFTARN